MKTWVRSAIGWGFVFFALAVTVLASSLVMNPDRINEPKFWLIVGMKILMSVLAFNISYFNVTTSLRTSDKALLDTYDNYHTYVERVVKKRLHAIVKRHIQETNKDRFVFNATMEIQKITNAIDYYDVINNKGKTESLIISLAADYRLSKREIRRLKAIVKKVLNGRIKYEKITYNHVMLNINESKQEHAKMRVNEGASLLIRNITMVATSTITSILFTIFALTEIGNWWWEIVANGANILLAIISAYFFGASFIKKYRNALQSRYDFLSEFIPDSDDAVMPKLPELSPALVQEKVEVQDVETMIVPIQNQSLPRVA